MGCDLDMTDDTGLAGDDAALTYDGRACDSALACHGRILSDYYVVGYKAKVIDSYAVLDDGRFHRGLVDSSIGTNLHVGTDDYVTDMLDLFPAAVGLQGVAETVVANNATCMEDSAVSDYGVRENK